MRNGTDRPDQRRFLHGHLMTCRKCVVEQFTFCPEVAAQGDDYREAVRDNVAMHSEFVDLVIKGRLRRIGK